MSSATLSRPTSQETSAADSEAPTRMQESETTVDAKNTSTAAAATVMSTASTASMHQMTLQEQNEFVFGNRNEKLADALADYCQDEISKGVKSLPLLSNKDKAKALEDTISKAFLRSVDIIEAYSKNNLFTLRQIPPRRRQRLLQTIQGSLPLPEINKSDSKSNNKESNVTATTATWWSIQSKEELPSEEDRHQLTQQVKDLTKALKDAQAQRKALLESKASLQTAQQVTSKAHETTSASAPTNVQDAVTEAVLGGQGLQELQSEGEQLTRTLKTKSASQSSQQSDDENFQRPRLVKKAKLLTLEEAYRQEKNLVLDGTNALESLSNLSNMLKQQNKK